MNIFTLILLMSLLSAILYRLGGCSKEDFPKVPGWLKDGLTRDIGCSICNILQLFFLASCFKLDIKPWQCLCYTLVGFWGLKSYWSWVNKFIMKLCVEVLERHNFKKTLCRKCSLDDGNSCKIETDKQWWNWLLVGLTMSSRWFFVFGWKAFPYVIVNGLLIMFVSLKYGDVNKEEFARGALFIL